MANWITLPSVSTTYSSVTVSVTGGIDLSSVLAGWALIINGVPVEIASGTAADADGNSALTLAAPWDGSPIANQPAKIQPTGAPFLAGITALEETNSYAIDVHNALAGIATLDKDVTIKDPTGEKHTFATMPKIAREAAEQRAGLATDYASTKTALSDDYEAKKAELTEIVNFKPPCPATLDCDFARNIYRVIDDYATGFVETSDYTQILSFTRASSANLTNAIGGQTTVGSNVLRRTFDPETGEALGAQIEERRTNYFINSESAVSDGIWVAKAGTNTTIEDSLINGSPAIKAISGAGGGRAAAILDSTSYNTVTLGESSVRAGVIVSGSSDDVIKIRRSGDSSNSYFEEDSRYHLAILVSTGEILYQGSKIDLLSAKIVNDALEFSIFSQLDSNSLAQNGYQFSLSKVGDSYSVFTDSSCSEGDWFSFTGIDIQEGTFPASYIKTDDTTVTREPDNLLRALGSEFRSKGFTVYLEITLNTAEEQAIVSSDGARILSRVTGGKFAFYDGLSSGVYSQNVQVGKKYIIAISCKKTSIMASTNGAVYDFSAGRGFSGMTSMTFAQASAGGAGSFTMKRFAIFPRTFDEATLSQVTTQGLD